MEIRDVAAQDHEGVASLIEAAFGGLRVTRLWEEVRSAGLARAELAAYDDDDTLVGHVGLSHCWLDARAELVDILMLSPLAVLPERQERGIGTGLVSAAIKRARRLAAPMLVLEGSPLYYGERGFTRASDQGLHPASVRIPDRAFQVAILEGRQDWMSGQVIYPDVWWRHDCAGLRGDELESLEERLGSSDPWR